MAFPGIGTVVNVGAIAMGSALGWLMGRRLPERVSEIVVQALALVVVVVGLQMAITAQTAAQFVVVLISMVTGATIGELANVERLLHRVGKAIEAWVARYCGPSPITQAFVTASILFLVGPMAILGAIQDGVLGDPSLLFVKSGLDGIISIPFTASMGIGTAFSVIPLALYQGFWTLAGLGIGEFLSQPAIEALSATGGIAIVGIGFNLLNVTQLRLGNFLPALPIAGAIAQWLPIWTIEF